MQVLIAVFLVVLAGISEALEAPTNALLVQNSNSVAFSTFVATTVGAIIMGVWLLVMRPQLQPAWPTTTPWYVFLGGFYGVIILAATAYATPKTGAGVTLVVLVITQVVMGVGLDHFGALGLEKHPANWLRIAGCVVAIGGALMVSLG